MWKHSYREWACAMPSTGELGAEHVFPRGVLTALTVVGGRVRGAGTRAGSACVEELPLCAAVTTALWEASQIPGHWSGSPKSHTWSASFYLGVWFYLFLHQDLCPWGVSAKASGAHSACALIWCSFRASPFVPHHQALYLASAPSILLGNSSTGSMWSLDEYGQVSSGRAAIIRGLGCLWCYSWGNANNGWDWLTQALPWDYVTSASEAWVSPKYSAYCNMEKVEQESSHDLGHKILVMGNTGATEVELSLSCLGCRPVCELLTSEIWASDHPPVSPSSPPTSQGGLSPSIGPQDCGLSCSPSKVGVCQCNVLFPLGPLSRAQILTWLLFFPSYLIMCVSFL